MILAVFFCATALLYACVGFGGGSTYNALLVLAETDYRLLPFIALGCNIIVVSGGVWHFARGGHISIRKTLPWIILSVPAAWLGGRLPVPETVFIGLLGTVLLLSGVRMLWPEKEDKALSLPGRKAVQTGYVAPAIGGVLGFVAGLTGIGGGIFLAPVLHLLRWSDPKNIAGTCSLFILVNSIAGMAGQAMKLADLQALSAVAEYWLLFPAVLVGGQVGSWLGASKINMTAVKKLTALLILYVAVRLLWRFWSMMV